MEKRCFIINIEEVDVVIINIVINIWIKFIKFSCHYYRLLKLTIYTSFNSMLKISRLPLLGIYCYIFL